jgi:formyltetrahydrofolate hydrolase
VAALRPVLSGDLCKWLEGKAINIHHSMLPSWYRAARLMFGRLP